MTPTRTYAYGTRKTSSVDGHNWIISKAIQHLERTSPVARVWPLASYLPWLMQGSWYADHTGAIDCTWTPPGYTYDCDTIHHYGVPGDLYTEFGIRFGNTGAFAAAEYTQALFDQALLFYPGGDKPDLGQLSYKDGGRAEHLLDTNELGHTHLGGLPFCERWVARSLINDYGREIARGRDRALL